MKQTKFVVLASALSFMFMGCPYESKMPLDDADKSKPDKALVGKWEEKGSDDYSWKCEMDGNQYRIEKKSTDGDDSEPTVYIGWLSDVGGKTWLNVYEQDYSSDKSYYLYQMEKKGEGDRLKFKAMTDNVTDEFATAEDLKTFIKKYQDLSFFYNKDDEKTFYKDED